MSRPWTPQEDLPGVRAVMDVRAGRTPTASGPVSSWASQFGSKAATQATAANQPTYGDAALGSGRPGLSFDGTDFLGGLSVDATSSSRTVVALASFANASTNRTIVGGTADGHFAFRRNAGRQMQVVASNAAAVATDPTVVPDGAAIVLSSRYTQATVADFRQNGRQTANVAPSGNAIAPSAVMQIGAALSGQQMVGAIGCVVVADAYVSDEDVARIEGWLAHANGAAALLVDGHPYKSAPPTVATQASAVSATGAATFAPMTGASAASAPVRATGGGTMRPMTSLAEARVLTSARSASRLRDMTGASEATAPSRGSGSSVLRDMTGSAEVRSLVRGRGDVVFRDATGDASGVIVPLGPIEGRGSGLLGDMSSSSLVGVLVRASGSATFASMTSSARAGSPEVVPKERLLRPPAEVRNHCPPAEARVVRAEEPHI